MRPDFSRGASPARWRHLTKLREWSCGDQRESMPVQHSRKTLKFLILKDPRRLPSAPPSRDNYGA